MAFNPSNPLLPSPTFLSLQVLHQHQLFSFKDKKKKTTYQKRISRFPQRIKPRQKQIKKKNSDSSVVQLSITRADFKIWRGKATDFWSFSTVIRCRKPSLKNKDWMQVPKSSFVYQRPLAGQIKLRCSQQYTFASIRKNPTQRLP